MNRQASPKQIAALALLLIAVGIAYAPLLSDFVAFTWRRSHYQHFPFVLLASALLGGRHLVSAPRGAVPRRGWAIAGAVAAWLLLLAGYQVPSPLLAAISFILLLGAGGCVLARCAGCSFPLASWGLAWLILPPPLGLDYRLIETLQRSSSWLASQALDVLGVDHLMDGNALVLVDKTLFVDEACSGIVSAVSIVTCAAMYAVWRKRGFTQGLLLMAASAGWAMLINVVRIVSIALAHQQMGLDLAEGWPHTMVGLVAFGLSLMTLVATDWLLKAALAEVGPRWSLQTGEPIRFGYWLVEIWDRYVASSDTVDRQHYSASAGLTWPRFVTGSASVATVFITSIAFAALSVNQLLQPTVLTRSAIDFPLADAFAERLKSSKVSEELSGLHLEESEHRRRDTKSVFGEHSVVYVYKSDNHDRYLVSCDFPFTGGWHELSICYRGIGWQIEDLAVLTVGEDRGEVEAGKSPLPYQVSQASLKKPDGRVALITYCACYQDGSPVSVPLPTLYDTVRRAFSRRDIVSDGRQYYQVQVLTERSDQITAADRDLSLDLLKEARQQFREIAAQRAGEELSPVASEGEDNPSEHETAEVAAP